MLKRYLLKILALSDVISWNGFKSVFDMVKPDILTLAGDLTSDGLAKFWNPVKCIEKHPHFRHKLAELERDYEERLKSLIPKSKHIRIKMRKGEAPWCKAQFSRRVSGG